MADAVLIDCSAWLTSHEVAELIGVSEGYLRVMRVHGRGPRFFRYGRRGGPVRYNRRDVETWLGACRERSA